MQAVQAVQAEDEVGPAVKKRTQVRAIVPGDGGESSMQAFNWCAPPYSSPVLS